MQVKDLKAQVLLIAQAIGTALKDTDLVVETLVVQFLGDVRTDAHLRGVAQVVQCRSLAGGTSSMRSRGKSAGNRRRPGWRRRRGPHSEVSSPCDSSVVSGCTCPAAAGSKGGTPCSITGPPFSLRRRIEVLPTVIRGAAAS